MKPIIVSEMHFRHVTIRTMQYGLVVFGSNAAVQPSTVVIHSCNAFVTQLAVARGVGPVPIGLGLISFRSYISTHYAISYTLTLQMPHNPVRAFTTETPGRLT